MIRSLMNQMIVFRPSLIAVCPWFRVKGSLWQKSESFQRAPYGENLLTRWRFFTSLRMFWQARDSCSSSFGSALLWGSQNRRTKGRICQFQHGVNHKTCPATWLQDIGRKGAGLLLGVCCLEMGRWHFRYHKQASGTGNGCRYRENEDGALAT